MFGKRDTDGVSDLTGKVLVLDLGGSYRNVHLTIVH